MSAEPHAYRAVERAARTSYGRLVAIISARTHDVAAAEDALGDAFAAALESWPVRGVPQQPEAWLVATAQRRLVDGSRHARVVERAEPQLAWAATMVAEHADAEDLPDRRLDLLFACAHPAIDVAARTPLMLQAVLGLDADSIAAAFLVSPASMAQRLVRAKRKIRDAGVPFEVAEPSQRAERVAAVLEAIYAAFAAGWDAIAGGDARRADLADEAIWLCRVVVDAMPGDAEARGLLALMLYCHARRASRGDADGRYVPLAEQDIARWDQAMIGEAEHELGLAARQRAPGRFQLEAAIQSAHLAPAFGHRRNWPAVEALYHALAACAPTVAVLVNRAAAIGEARGAAAGLAALDAVAAGELSTYQPWWALRAHLLAASGQVLESRDAYSMAAGLTASDGTRRFLLARRDALAMHS